MAKPVTSLLPASEELLRQLGERLRLARLRRHLSIERIAERAGLAPMTLRNVEQGRAGVTIGAFLAVMQTLGIEKDLDLLAQADPLGRALQDAKLPAHYRVKARVPRAHDDQPVPVAQARELPKPKESDEPERRWVAEPGFASARQLAKAIAPAACPHRSRRR